MKRIISHCQGFVADHHQTMIRFGLVGVANTLVDLVTYFSLTRSLGLSGIWLVWMKGVSFLIATVFSFFANRYFTFEQTTMVRWREFLKFYLAVGSGVVLNMSAVFVIHLLWKIDDLWAVLMATGVSFIWSFTVSRFWVFKSEECE